MGYRLKWLLFSLLVAVSLTSASLAATGRARPFSNSGSIIISEVAWAGSAGEDFFEWIELYNRSNVPIDVGGWRLASSQDINIALGGTIEPGGFYLLERRDDAVADVTADFTYKGALPDSGETLELFDDLDQIIDSANADGGSWPAGTGSPDFRSMERTDPELADSNTNWNSNDSLTRNGIDGLGNPINGTPGQANSAWSSPTSHPDLFIEKSGPVTAAAGDLINYVLHYGNIGNETGLGAKLTDSLPIGLAYVTDTSGLPVLLVDSKTLVWHLGDLPAGMDTTFQLSLQSDPLIAGSLSNAVHIGSGSQENNINNNQDSFTTQIEGSGGIRILIDAVYYDANEAFEPDEAIRLINVGPTTVDASGWSLGDGESEVYLPEMSYLSPFTPVWLCKNANAFARQFGFEPAYAAETSNSKASLLSGSWPRLSNNGDEVNLLDSGGQLMDVVVYKQGDTSTTGWQGPSVQPYVVTGVFGESGQILYRMREQKNGHPVIDTDSAADWAQSLADPINGRRVQYPGWDIDEFFFPAKNTEQAEVIVGITPDNGYELLLAEIQEAQSSIKLEVHTLTHLELGSALIDASLRGVIVTVLLEGAPVGGIEAEQIQVCDLLLDAGGQCWYMISDSASDIYDRYRYLHAKFMVIDGKRAVISSENFSPNSLPIDDKSDGTFGRRGVILVTDATSVVQRLQAIWNADFDPKNHADIASHTQLNLEAFEIDSEKKQLYGEAPISYTVRFSEPTAFTGTFSFEVIQSPENSLRDEDGIINLMEQTGKNDTILVEQLTERPYWGSASGSFETDPNPRLLAYLNAARRGTKVRILLDSFFEGSDETNLNLETCQLVNSIADQENLDLFCQLGNPTGLGIHNKMILVKHNGRGYAFSGSINGSELSHKGNREVGLIISSTEVYNLLAQMFEYDWPSRIFFPAIYNHYIPPANHVLVSEVLYDPAGREEAEFIELVNPTRAPIDLSGYGLGDAVDRDDFEDVRRFPSGSVLAPEAVYVVALTASGFRAEFGYDPDFEIVDSSVDVADLIDDPSWGHPAAVLRLGNQGDEIILRDPLDQVVDGIAYGSGNLPGTVACPAVIGSDYSLERNPYWRDTDDCPYDFREWPFPNPGWLP